ncbi:MAG: hypothetical protein LBP91_02340 [Coriobacteriales bacterium]|jgi:hypothetical protein|nr:hypothetical protein [Coriobacteriales bacterium]
MTRRDTVRKLRMNRGKLLRITVGIALAMSMLFGGALPAYAANDPITGTEQDPAAAAITKTLKMGEGVSTPEVTFSFAFTPVSVDGATSGADYNNMPPVSLKTVAFDPDTDTGTTASGIKTVSKETESLFGAITWPHAGVYIYDVVETQSLASGTLSVQEKILYSSAKYRISVFVANGTSGLFVAAIGAEVAIIDTPDGAEAGDKVDGRLGGDPEVSGDFSRIIFTNTYQKTTGTGDPLEYVLAISKTVTMDNTIDYDFANRERYFDFEVTVTKSNANANATQTYKAYVLDTNGVNVTSAFNYTGTLEEDSTYGDYIEFTTASQATVHLKHGQYLSFVDLEVGATYSVTELAAPDFTPSCEQTIDDVATNIPGTVNTNLSIPGTGITEGDDRADFTNVYKTVTPTGIGIDELPFFVLAGLALTGLVVFAALRYRRRRTENDA